MMTVSEDCTYKLKQCQWLLDGRVCARMGPAKLRADGASCCKTHAIFFNNSWSTVKTTVLA